MLDGFPFRFDNSPACPSTRQTLDGLTATMLASSIMAVMPSPTTNRPVPRLRSEFPKALF